MVTEVIKLEKGYEKARPLRSTRELRSRAIQHNVVIYNLFTSRKPT